MVSVEAPETMRRFSTSCHGGARQRPHVDAAVIVEALVLEGHEHGEIALIDVGGFDGKAPAAVRRGEGAQQPVAPVEDGRRDFLRRLEIGRPDPINRDVGAGRENGNRAGNVAGTDRRMPQHAA